MLSVYMDLIGKLPDELDTSMKSTKVPISPQHKLHELVCSR